MLENPIRSYRFLKDGYGISEKNERTPPHSVKF